MMKKLRRVVALLIVAAMLTAVAGCEREVTSEDLMTDITPVNVSERNFDDDFEQDYTSFAFKLLASLYTADGGNIAISPLSIGIDMSMLGSGAKGDTLKEIESMYGSSNKSYSIDQQSVYLHTYRDRLGDTEQVFLRSKHALWFNADKNAAPDKEFLQRIANYYDVAAFKDSFGETTVQNINNWISNETGQTIEYIYDDLPTDAAMYMLNVTALQADWAKPYAYDQVHDSTFTNASGVEQKAVMMSSFESGYIIGEEGEGFYKDYAGGDYAFVALLPYDWIDMSEFLSHLSIGGKWERMSSWRNSETVSATVPKFSCDYSIGMSEALKAVGVKQTFDEKAADFSAMGTADGNLYPSDLYMRTIMSVTEKGTDRGTSANANTQTVEKTHVVTLNRPFVYMIVDCNKYAPIVVGVVNTMQ